MFFWVSHNLLSFTILLTYLVDIALSNEHSNFFMSKSFKTFLKHTAKDFHNHSVNPPVVRASTIIFKTLQDIKKTQSNYKKNPLSKNFDYGRKGTSTTFALQELLRKIENAYQVYLTPTGFGAVFLGVISVVRPGDEIIITDSVYSPTRFLTEDYLKKFNIKAVFYDPKNLDDLKKKLQIRLNLFLLKTQEVTHLNFKI